MLGAALSSDAPGAGRSGAEARAAAGSAEARKPNAGTRNGTRSTHKKLIYWCTLSRAPRKGFHPLFSGNTTGFMRYPNI